MKNLKKKLLSTSLILASIAVLGGCTSRSQSSDPSVVNATEDILIDSVAVESIILEPGDHYEQIYVAGKLAAQDEYNVLPYTVGVVKEIMVETGDKVSVGDVLYTLDSSDLESNRDDTLTSLLRSRDQAYNSLTLAQNDLSSSQMNLDNAQKNYEDNLRLFEGGFIAQASIDGYDNALKSANIAYERAGITLDNAETSYASAADNYTNNVESFAGNLEDMTITSPIDGTITRVDVQIDVTNNMNAGVTVTGSGDILVLGNVIEKYINTVENGQHTSVEIKAVGKSLEGEITSVATSSSNSYYPIEVTLENGNGDLKAGMFAGVTVDTTLAENIITVPKTSVLGTGSTKYVFVDADGSASKILVNTGRDFGEVIEITEGLATGDALIVEGQIYLEEGTPLIVSLELGQK